MKHDALRKGARLDLLATGMDRFGSGLASLEGKEIRIADLAIGERATVEIDHVSRGGPVAHAHVVERLESSKARREPPCPNHSSRDGACTGCPLMGLEESAQREVKRLMLESLGISVDIVEPPPAALGYRHSSKRVAFEQYGGLRLGSFVRGTHRPAEMRACLVEHPLVRAAADQVAKLGSRFGVRAFSEQHPDGLRYAWFKTNGVDVLVTLIWGAEPGDGAHRLATALEVAGVAHSVQSDESNSFRGANAEPATGATSIEVHHADMDVDGIALRSEVGPLGFLQPNLELARQLYADLLSDEEGVPLRGSMAFDLYAGAGITTRMLQHHFDVVKPCESHPESARALGVDPTAAGAFLESSNEVPDAVIANPPRKGLGPTVCKQLCTLGVKQLNIMSCGPAGLARDLEHLTGRYRLVSVRAYDALPQTAHVEIIAKLRLA